jgi:tetratricopeptide (TPR) repeat protein
MQMKQTMKKTLRSLVCALAIAGAVPTALRVCAAPPAAAPTEDSKLEYKANDMLNKGVELVEQKQEERGIKMIQSVPTMFPKSKARFKAFLALGRIFMSKGQFDQAIRQYEHMSESDVADEQAEGLYQTGIGYYNLANYDKAFISLRRVTSEFPWSVFANESYYYIGQCHFKLGRWAKAVEALEMVGTSVDPDSKDAIVAEAGQRLYVKIFDKDLIVLRNSGEKIPATLTTKSGDKETITLEPLGRTGEYYIGSIMTVPGEPKPGDGILQIIGGDVVTVEYNDKQTESGAQNVKRVVTVKMVSTASVGFTDGAYREYTKGVFADQDCFIRVRDLDRDTTAGKDTIQVKVYAEYKVEKKEGDDADPKKDAVAAKASDDSTEAPQLAQRAPVMVTLTETEAHSGIFVGSILPHVVTNPSQLSGSPSQLVAMNGDDLVIEYVDEARADSPDPKVVTYKARLLMGQIQDVKVEHRVVDSLDLKARKNLIEARIYLKLGAIFKEVGLIQKAHEKATEGLDRVEEVIGTSLRASLDRSLVEEAFSVKWDLLLVQDKLGEAIAVCRSLMQLFPDSSLVDKALLKIGMAKMEGPNPNEAIGIFSGVISLPKSELKAEAQFHIGEVEESQAMLQAERSKQPAVLSQAMLSYKKCVEMYPNSPFAGEALDKIASYYIGTKDYARAVELMEQVFQDYPDASFLDKMLLKWVIASYRMGNYAVAKQKAEQLLSEYPNSKSAEKARTFLEVINKKLNAAGGTN